jgi:ABC-type lipopolysaccharide export system ATPase subunit
MDTAVSVQNVDRVFAKDSVVNYFSFAIERDEIFELLNPNDARKSASI